MDDCIKRRIPGPLIPESFCRVDRLEKYVHLGRMRSFSKGEIVLSQGAESNTLIYVQTGSLSVSIGADDGHDKFLFYIGERSIGMTTFLSECHEIQIVAVKNSRVFFFTLEQIMAIFHKEEQIILDIFQNIVSKVYYFMAQARDLNYCRPSSRVFRLLYNLCINEGKYVDGCYQIDTKLTQKAIGEITGTHYVTVCKLLSLLDKQGILKKTKDKIVVHNLERLKALIYEVIEY